MAPLIMASGETMRSGPTRSRRPMGAIGEAPLRASRAAESDALRVALGAMTSVAEAQHRADQYFASRSSQFLAQMRTIAAHMPPLLATYLREAPLTRDDPSVPIAPLACPTGRAIAASAATLQVACITNGLRIILTFVEHPSLGDPDTHDSAGALLSLLFLHDQLYSAEDLHHILQELAARTAAWGWGVPLPGLLCSVARRLASSNLTPELAVDLAAVQRAGAAYARTAEQRRALLLLAAALRRRPLEDGLDQEDRTSACPVAVWSRPASLTSAGLA